MSLYLSKHLENAMHLLSSIARLISTYGACFSIKVQAPDLCIPAVIYLQSGTALVSVITLAHKGVTCAARHLSSVPNIRQMHSTAAQTRPPGPPRGACARLQLLSRYVQTTMLQASPQS